MKSTRSHCHYLYPLCGFIELHFESLELREGKTPVFSHVRAAMDVEFTNQILPSFSLNMKIMTVCFLFTIFVRLIFMLGD